MNIKFKILAIIFCTLWLSGCKSIREEELKPLSPDSKVEWIKNVNSVNEIYKKLGVIKLDNSKDALLSSPKKILFNHDTFLIVDGTSVKKYDLDGKFICKIGKNGSGPGEYKFPAIVCADDEDIIIYDNSLGRINIYDTITGEIEKHISMQYECKEILLYKTCIIIIREEKSNRQITKYMLERYSKSGSFLSSEELIKPTYPKELCYLSGIGIYKIVGDRMYFIHSDDMKIKCYDLDKKKKLWQCIQVSERLNLEPMKSDKNDLENEKWVMARSRLYGMEVITDSFIQVRTEKGIMIYDLNGNYLKFIQFKDSPFKSSVITNNKKYLYNIVLPDDNRVTDIPQNFSIWRFEIENK